MHLVSFIMGVPSIHNNL